MKRTRQFLFCFFALGVILSCAKAPLPSLDARKNIRLHPLYAMPRGHLGPAIYFGVDEGVDSEKIRGSIVRLIYGEGDSRIVSSGFFVAPDKIATNIHVVAGADMDSLHVRSTDTDHVIQGVTAFDAQNDLVVLKVSGEGGPLALGDSNGVKRGDTVFSVGYPMDRYNVMKNSVGAVQRNSPRIQMTSNILPGTSGGPVLNTEGEVIGINFGGSGPYGYAIASNRLKVLLDRSDPTESLVKWRNRPQIRAYTYLGQANQKFFEGLDSAGGINALNKVIELNPTYIGIDMVYNNRGYVNTHLGHSTFRKGEAEKAQRYYQAAIADFQKAIAIYPEDISAYISHGSVSTYLGHMDFSRGSVEAAQTYYHAAIEDFDKTIRVTPTYLAHTERGEARLSLGLLEASRGGIEGAAQYYSAAIEDCNKSIHLNPGEAYTYNVRGYVRMCLGHLEADRGNTDAAHALYKAAITDCDSAIRLDSENPYHYHTRGVATAALDNFSGAVADFDTTLSLKSDFARAYYNRALAKVILGQQDAAKVDFEKARELGLDVEKE